LRTTAATTAFACSSGTPLMQRVCVECAIALSREVTVCGQNCRELEQGIQKPDDLSFSSTWETKQVQYKLHLNEWPSAIL
jgi:hypothetical protein